MRGVAQFASLPLSLPYGLKSVGLFCLLAFAPIAAASQSQSAYSALVILVIIVLFCLLLALLCYRRSVRYLLHNSFARIKIDQDSQQVSFYKRHQSRPAKILSITDIKQCRIQFDNQTLVVIGQHSNQCFTQSEEAYFSQQLRRGYQQKLIGRQVRRIVLTLSTGIVDYPVCLYLRRGCNRLTRTSFDDIRLQLIDYCWLLSSYLHPEQPARPIIEQIVVKEDMTPSDVPKVNAAGVLAVDSKCERIDAPEVPKSEVKAEPPSEVFDVSTSPMLAEDIEVVNALEKLARLNQKGQLTDEEFQRAKNKLLSDLTNKPAP